MTTQKALPWQTMLLYFCSWVSCSKPNRKRSKQGKISKPSEQNVCPVTFLQKQITDLPGHPGPVTMSSTTSPSLLGVHGEQQQPTSPAPGTARISRHVSPWGERLIFSRYLKSPTLGNSAHVHRTIRNHAIFIYIFIYLLSVNYHVLKHASISVQL